MKRILIVDDEAPIRFLIQTILTAQGYKTATASNCDEALHLASKQPFDLAVVDLILPGTDGIETMLLLHARQPRLRIIAMSGGWNGGAQTCLPLAEKLGACVTLAKPFGQTALLDAIEREIGLPQQLEPVG